MNQLPSSQSGRYKAGKNSFPAVLKTADGAFLESGQASVSVEDASVDFSADFVPLYKMGTSLQIIRTFGKQEIHRFTGEVYLSSERYLRLTSVRDFLLEDSEKAYLFPAEIPARIFLLLSPEASPAPSGLRRLRKKKTETVSDTFDVTVTMISMDSIEFLCGEELPPYESLRLSMESPVILDKIALSIRRVLRFGTGGVKYSCAILPLEDAVRQSWETYLRALHQRTNKLF